MREGGTEAPSGLDKGIKDKGGLDGTSRDDGESRGGGSISRAASQFIKSRSMSSSPRGMNSSPSAAVQGAPLHSMLTQPMAGSLVVGRVASSCTCSDVLCSSSSVAIRGSVAPCDDGSSVSGGLRHALHAAGRWWAGHWVGSGSGEIIHMANGEW